MNTYIALAYKEDSADYCRGCHMASYSSDFEYIQTSDVDELTRFWIDISFRNSRLNISESGYELTLLIPTIADEDARAEEISSIQDMLETAYFQEVEKRRLEEQRKEEVRKQKAEEARIKREAQQLIEQEQKDRQLYNELKQKFG